MLDFQILTFSHFFRVDVFTATGRSVIMAFCREFARFELTSQGYNKPKMQELKMTYAWRSDDFKEFRFHIGQLPLLKEFLDRRGFSDNAWRIGKAETYEALPVKYKLRDGLVLKDFQDEAKTFSLAEETKYHNVRGINYPDGNQTRLIGLRTGAGKTITALAIAADIGKRFVVAVLPKYMDKWCSDISETLGVKPKEIMQISGRNQLIAVGHMSAKGELDHIKAFVVSIPTLRNYVTEYAVNGSRDNWTPPEVLFRGLKCGYGIIDEAHEHFDSVYYSLLMFDVKLLIALSATVMSEDAIVRKMHNIVFPYTKRYNKIVAAGFANLIEVIYYIRNFDPRRIRYNQNGMYSHALFELSILRDKKLLDSYMSFIAECLEHDYLHDYRKGDKALIYVARIEFGTVLTRFLKQRYPSLDVRRVMENDPYENAIEPDIRVGSQQRLGTALDIPGLICVLDSQAMSSQVTNIQKFGRLRFIPDRTLNFRYLVCANIPKHVNYSKKRQETLADRYKGFKSYQAHRVV